MALWSRPRKIGLLETIPSFRGLSRKELGDLARLADEVQVPAGKRLARAGEIGHEFFIILKGQAGVRTPRGRRVRLGPGDFFGEISLLDGEPRSADVEALTPMTLLAIGHREFWSLLDESPIITRKILRALASRLREAEKDASS